MWGGGDYERIAEGFADVHDRLVAALRPQAGERWLDLATGTGEVALRAAGVGADVVGVDISESLLEQARAKPGGAGVRWLLADAQALPFDDRAFDVVSCCFGVMFPPDPEAVARELARVCRPDARIGLTTWRPIERIFEIYRRFGRAHVGDYDRWGTEDGIRGLLGRDFELKIEAGNSPMECGSAAELYDLQAEAAPPWKAFLGGIDDAARARFRAEMLAYWAAFETPEGAVSEPREYLLVLGSRR